MRGSFHIFSGVIFLFVLFFLDFFLFNYLFSLVFSESFLVIFFVFYLFFAGTLLPDSDMRGSKIFRFFFPIALINWFLGLILSLLNFKFFRHRGVLHKPLGVILSSFFVGSLFYGLLFIIFGVSFNVFFLFVTSLLLGQILHLIFDS